MDVAGPGCGKSTFLRTLNRMNDLIEDVRIDGKVLLKGEDINDMDVNVLRSRVGMVFQKANPFPMSVYDNIAYGPRILGIHKKKELDKIVEKSLKQAAIWNECKDRLKTSALGMSGGQQQMRLFYCWSICGLRRFFFRRYMYIFSGSSPLTMGIATRGRYLTPGLNAR